MAKVSQVLQNLEKNIQTQEQQITEIYRKKSEELEKNLIKEFQETQKQIKENIKLQKINNNKEIKQILENIDWELEKCRTQKKILWGIGGLIVGVMITLLSQQMIHLFVTILK